MNVMNIRHFFNGENLRVSHIPFKVVHQTPSCISNDIAAVFNNGVQYFCQVAL